MDSTLLDIIACPICHGHLLYDKHGKALLCQVDRLAYPIVDEVPIMLVKQAKPYKEHC